MRVAWELTFPLHSHAILADLISFYRYSAPVLASPR